MLHLPTLRLFRAEEASAKALEIDTERFRAATMRVLSLAFLSGAVLEFFASLGIALVAVYIGLSLLNQPLLGLETLAESVTLGEGLLLLLLAPEYFAPLRRFAAQYHDRANAVAAAQSLQALIREDAGKAKTAPAVPAPQTGALGVRMIDVTVRYPDGRMGLDGVSFSLAPGDRCVVQGASGAGKSTLIAALMGFVPNSNGDIALVTEQGQLAAASVTERRRQIAWIGQNPFLFHGSLRANLRLADPDADDDALQAACAKAQLGPVLDRLPGGLDQPLGEGGAGLSGGEAQRVALARALLRHAPLVVMDEPTSALDAENAALFRDALSALPAETTVIIATHDPDLMAWGGRRVTLSGGRVIADQVLQAAEAAHV